MNDFDYDVLEKKRTARGARHKVGQRKGCRLPCDGLKQAQIRQRHGEVYTVNLNNAIRYAEYKKLPLDMREMYYNHLVDEFHVGQGPIAQMMGVKANTLWLHNSRSGGNFKGHGKATGDNLRRFERWYGAQFAERAVINPEMLPEEGKAPEKTMEAPVVPKAEPVDRKIPVSRYDLHFNHVTSWEELTTFLAGMPLPEDACIIINVRKALKEDME